MSENLVETRRSWGRDLLVLTLLLGLLFGALLGRRALWSPDEGRYSEIPREMVATGDYLTPRLNGVKYFEKPPFFYWLQSFSIRLFGLQEWSLRLWTVLFALVGCLTVYVAGRKLFDRRTGLISAAVLATSPLYYGMGQIITLDMAVSVLLACALLSFLWGTQELPGFRRRLALWAFFAFSALATMTKGLIGFVIPALVIGTWMLLLKEWRLLKTMYLASGLTLFFLIVAPWHILVAQANPEFVGFYLIHEHFQRYLFKHHGMSQKPWFFIPVILLGLFPWSAFLFQALCRHLCSSWRQIGNNREVLLLILWAGWVFLFFSGSSSKLVPYILPMFPPLALLIGCYFAAAWDRDDTGGVRAGYWVVFVGAAVLVAGSLILGSRYLEEPLFTETLTDYTAAITAVMVLGPLMFLLLGRVWGFSKAFWPLVATCALCLLVQSSGSTLVDQVRSVKYLAKVLHPQLQPEDEVASYQTYYQDLPVYLQRRITVVAWKGELEFGSQVEDVGGWIIGDGTFWQRWNSPRTVYMLTRRAKYDQLLAASEQTFYLLAQTDWNVLLSNKDRGRKSPGQVRLSGLEP